MSCSWARVGRLAAMAHDISFLVHIAPTNLVLGPCFLSPVPQSSVGHRARTVLQASDVAWTLVGWPAELGWSLVRAEQDASHTGRDAALEVALVSESLVVRHEHEHTAFVQVG